MKPEDHPSDADDLRARAKASLRAKSATPPEALAAMTPESTRRLLHELQVHQIELEMQNEELRYTQQELEISRARYFDLFNLAPVGYFTVSKQGLILEANLTAALLLGLPLSTLRMQPLTRFIIKEDQDLYHLHCKKTFETQESQVCELQMMKMDQTRFWALLEAAFVPNGEGEPTCQVVLSDITRLKQLEQTLRDWGTDLEHQVALRNAKLIQSESRFRQLSETTFEGVAVSENGILLDGNARLAEIFGYDLTEMIGRPIADWIAPESRDIVAENIRISDETTYEFFGLRKDGSVFPAETHAAQKTWQGRMTRIAAIRDLTAAKLATTNLHKKQIELERVQQLALIGEVGAGILHQLCQPLSAIGANVSAVITRLTKEKLTTPSLLEELNEIQDNVASMRQIVIHLRALAHPENPVQLKIDLNNLITEILPLLQHRAENAKARMVATLSPDLPCVQADAVQISQVILNLSYNALDACQDCPPNRRIVEIATRAIDENHIEVSVRDAGTGISPENMKQLFNPFFTTKPKGFGVGLRLSRAIVQAHGGTLACDNNPEEFGATFRIILPVNPPSHSPQSSVKRL